MLHRQQGPKPQAPQLSQVHQCVVFSLLKRAVVPSAAIPATFLAMHALAFRVMRLCRPDLPSHGLLRADFTTDFAPDIVAARGPPQHENAVKSQCTELAST